MNYSKSDFTLGILGGGQLGKMLLQITSRLSIKTNVFEIYLYLVELLFN